MSDRGALAVLATAIGGAVDKNRPALKRANWSRQSADLKHDWKATSLCERSFISDA
ncbi:MAG: hypothetical protein IT342_14585 [Candidatus Melainabacteria bacterium]|nr:hypothetical protein [Candidatus Melainabacteria bacterium]